MLAGAFFTQFLTQIAQTSCQADASIGNCIPNTDPRRDSAAVQNDPETCTYSIAEGLTADPTWSTVYVTIAHNVWQYYGATNVVRTHYTQLKQYMNMVESRKNQSGPRSNPFAYSVFRTRITPCYPYRVEVGPYLRTQDYPMFCVAHSCRSRQNLLRFRRLVPFSPTNHVVGGQGIRRAQLPPYAYPRS